MFCSPRAPRFPQFTALQDCSLAFPESGKSSLCQRLSSIHPDVFQSRFPTSVYIRQIPHRGVSPEANWNLCVCREKLTRPTSRRETRNPSNVPLLLSHQLLRLFFHLFRELQRLLSAPTLLAVGALFRSLQSSIKDNCMLRKVLLKEPSI